MGSKRDTLKRRVRKTVKWGGAGLTVLLVVVWIGSRWLGFRAIAEDDDNLWLGQGQLAYFDMKHSDNERDGPVPYAGWYWIQYDTSDDDPSDDPLPPFRIPSQLRWGFQWYQWQNYPGFVIPLWLPALLSLLATAAAWRADLKYIRRARAGLCAGCGYERAGLAADAVCPECGSAGLPHVQ